jgi:hypothetical protein
MGTVFLRPSIAIAPSADTVPGNTGIYLQFFRAKTEVGRLSL